jgi:hypothetical protein
VSKIVYTVNGKEVTREEFRQGGKDDWLEAPPMASHTYSAHDPLVSDGLGCLKSQVKQLRETIKRHSIQGVEVKNDGQLEITSRRGRKELLAVRGLVDNDGGYSDG